LILSRHDIEQMTDGQREIFYAGAIGEKTRVLNALRSYFELTRFSEEVEGAEPNSEWDRGYQAAMAIVQGSVK